MQDVVHLSELLVRQHGGAACRHPRLVPLLHRLSPKVRGPNVPLCEANAPSMHMPLQIQPAGPSLTLDEGAKERLPYVALGHMGVEYREQGLASLHILFVRGMRRTAGKDTGSAI